MSPDLARFYLAYRDWLDSGAPKDHRIFSRKIGLCMGIIRFCRSQGIDFLSQNEMKQQFEQAGLSSLLPWP